MKAFVWYFPVVPLVIVILFRLVRHALIQRVKSSSVSILFYFRGMVPALDVIHSRVAVARVKDGSAGRHRHHRHHRHSYLGYQSSESGYSATSAPPAAKGSQVLLELGPESAPSPKHVPG